MLVCRRQGTNKGFHITSTGFGSFTREAATSAVTRTLTDLNDVTQKAIAHSKDTATSSVKEMLETHTMLRADTTSLFERLREANILLQEVLSGTHENMGALENTLMMRVSEFVTAMNDVTASTGDATGRVETNIANFRDCFDGNGLIRPGKRSQEFGFLIAQRVHHVSEDVGERIIAWRAGREMI